MNFIAEKTQNVENRIFNGGKDKKIKKSALDDLERGETALEARNITKTFPGGVVANDGVNFDIKARTGILLVSESIDQTLTLSDRIAPIYEGEFVDILSREEASKRKVGAMMAGLQDG